MVITEARGGHIHSNDRDHGFSMITEELGGRRSSGITLRGMITEAWWRPERRLGVMTEAWRGGSGGWG
jgi:hypothetical protein